MLGLLVGAMAVGGSFLEEEEGRGEGWEGMGWDGRGLVDVVLWR